ncbi:trehalose-6-phosphate synthase [bacterium]|nr:trehalose-6-phosphate synthase [bacterium]
MRRTTRDAALSDYRAAIARLCRDDLGGCNLIVASNRGPVEFRREGQGRLTYRRGQGGLVTAMRSMVEVLDTTWVASPLSEDDARAHQEAGGNLTVPMGDKQLRLAFVPSDPACFSAYYDDVSNSLLWFLQHGITNAPEHPEFDTRAWQAWESYRQVNLEFAQAIAREASRSERRPVVLVQDYHLYLVPLFLRRLLPEAFIQHFTHIAWPSSDAWRQLPGAIREELLKSLLSCEIIGFHTPRYVKNFCLTCEDLLGVEADAQEGRVSYQGREVAVRAYPISVDPDELSRFAASSEVAEQERRLVEGRIKQTLNLVQVARTDPSKNILRSLKAFELFLDQHPQYHGKVRFWGVLPASRQGAKGYRDYLDRLKAKAEAINRRFKRWGWEPVSCTFENQYARAIAVMKHYDVLLVNSLADGMNLVAKEGPIVNQRKGVLLLSETAGACEELSDGALSINPYDLVGMADALKQALTMPMPQRERLQGLLRRRIQSNPVFRWVHTQLSDIAEAQAANPTRLWVAGPWLPSGEAAAEGKERPQDA